MHWSKDCKDPKAPQWCADRKATCKPKSNSALANVAALNNNTLTLTSTTLAGGYNAFTHNNLPTATIFKHHSYSAKNVVAATAFAALVNKILLNTGASISMTGAGCSRLGSKASD